MASFDERRCSPCNIATHTQTGRVKMENFVSQMLITWGFLFCISCRRFILCASMVSYPARAGSCTPRPITAHASNTWNVLAHLPGWFSERGNQDHHAASAEQSCGWGVNEQTHIQREHQMRTHLVTFLAKALEWLPFHSLLKAEACSSPGSTNTVIDVDGFRQVQRLPLSLKNKGINISFVTSSKLTYEFSQ